MHSRARYLRRYSVNFLDTYDIDDDLSPQIDFLYDQDPITANIVKELHFTEAMCLIRRVAIAVIALCYISMAWIFPVFSWTSAISQLLELETTPWKYALNVSRTLIDTPWYAELGFHVLFIVFAVYFFDALWTPEYRKNILMSDLFFHWQKLLNSGHLRKDVLPKEIHYRHNFSSAHSALARRLRFSMLHGSFIGSLNPEEKILRAYGPSIEGDRKVNKAVAEYKALYVKRLLSKMLAILVLAFLLAAFVLSGLITPVFDPFDTYEDTVRNYKENYHVSRALVDGLSALPSYYRVIAVVLIVPLCFLSFVWLIHPGWLAKGREPLRRRLVELHQIGDLAELFAFDNPKSNQGEHALNSTDRVQKRLSRPSPRPVAFVCHAAEDKAAVRRLHSRLQQDGFFTWLDEECLLPGQNWKVEIRKAIRLSGAMIVCLSARSVSKVGYVQKEIKLGLDILDEHPEGSIFLIPVKLEECEVPERLADLHWVSMESEEGYQQLLRSLREAVCAES